MNGDPYTALALCAFAGIATGIGSVIALLGRQTSTRFLSVALGFSAGVMVFVSFAEILPKAYSQIEESDGKTAGELWSVIAFFLGMLIAAIIDRLLPEAGNPHEPHDTAEMSNPSHHPLMRVGLFSAVALGLHNFPEGIATFMAALHDTDVGIAVAIAVAIHNIPEGIAVAVPVYCATGNKWKAFSWSFYSGLAEPFGALVAFALLGGSLLSSPFVFGVVFAAVAGIMVFISLDELLPSAQKYGEHHLATYGMMAGMMVMAISLVLLRVG